MVQKRRRSHVVQLVTGVGLWVWACHAAFAQAPPASTGTSVASLAASATAPDAAVFFRDADFSEAILSPNGKRLALTSRKATGRKALYVVDTATLKDFKLIAHFSDADVVKVLWLDDGQLLFSATDFSDGSGRPNGGPGLFVVGYDGQDFRTLIERKTYMLVDGSRRSTALDGHHALLQVPRLHDGVAGTEILVGRYDKTSDGGHTVHPLWLNVKTGRTHSPQLNAPSGPVAWKFDSKGEARVVFTRQKDKQAAYWRGTGETEWKKLVEGDLLELPFTPHTVDDAGNLYVTLKVGAAGTSELFRYDFASNAPAPAALVSTPGFDFLGSLIVERGTGAAQGVRVTTDGETTVWFDAELKRVQAVVDERLPGRINRISCRQCAKDDATVLVFSYSDQDPGKWLLFHPKPAAGQAAWLPVASVRADVNPKQMATVDFQRIKARDGRDLPVWITAPIGVAPGKPAPTVVMVHGGPWVKGGHWAWNGMNQFLASRGYLVIEPEFRGSTGYGDAHLKAGFKQWGQTMQDDVADALLWAQKQGLASDKACIAGASYGGYSTLMGLVRHPQLYRCGAAWMAVTDLELLVKGSWWVGDDVSDVARKYSIPTMVGDMDKDADYIHANSPVLLAEKINKPILLAFGEDDQRVPLAHGKRMREALQKHGHEPAWISYPGEGHGWAKPENRLDFGKRLEQFLQQHLGQSTQ